MSPTISNNIDSKSYVIITCGDDVNPEIDRIELRTEPPTFIELKPGENVLTIEEYPDLKYGFRIFYRRDKRGLADAYPNQRIIGIDLSNFDGSEMTIMDGMFEGLVNLQSLNLLNLNTTNVISMESAFAGINLPETTKLTFSTLNVKNMKRMFCGAEISELDLSSFNVMNVEDFEEMFASSEINKLILDGWNFRESVNLYLIFECIHLDENFKLSLKGCNERTILDICNQLVNTVHDEFADEEDDYVFNDLSQQVILDNNMMVNIDPEGEIELLK